jgi:hypothetical protein
MNGYQHEITGQAFESYETLHKHLRHVYGDKAVERLFKYQQLSTNAAVEVSEKGTLTLSDAGKTALTLVLACDTNDNAYDTKTVTVHYYTNAGVAKTVVATYDPTATTTEVAVCSDFYCWNLDDYTAATVIVSSVAVQAGDNVYIGTTGMVAGAEKRYATIAAAATYPVVTTLFGVGNVFCAEEANTAGDVGKVITLEYVNPWGKIRTATATLAADTTTISRFGLTLGMVMDFYRVRAMTTTAALGKYVIAAIDADKVVGTVALDTNYAVIEEANYLSVHSRYMCPAAAYRSGYLGEIEVSAPSVTDTYTLTVIFTPYGKATSSTVVYDVFGSGKMDLPFKLEPLSEVTLKVNDGNVAHVNCNVGMKIIEVVV